MQRVCQSFVNKKKEPPAAAGSESDKTEPKGSEDVGYKNQTNESPKHENVPKL